MKKKLLMVGRTRYRLPLDANLARKFDALDDAFELRVLAARAEGADGSDDRFRLVRAFRPRALDGLVFHLTLPFRVARELRRFRPDAVVAQGAHEAAATLVGRALARSRARVVLDVHGDWRTATRLYGSPSRRLVSPLADQVARAAVRRADAVRTVSDYTTELARAEGVEPAAVFPAFMDLDPFLERPPEPLRERPGALFVGVLERYKNVDGLAAAWRSAAPRVPGAELRLIGRGSLTDVVEALVRELPEQTSWRTRATTDEVACALDDSWFLVLPSRSEGMGRVIVEAFCRGRPVLGTRVGGIADLVEDGVNGVLVEPGDTRSLADALVSLLDDRARVERLAEGARESAQRWRSSPDEYAAALAEVVERATAVR